MSRPCFPRLLGVLFIAALGGIASAFAADAPQRLVSRPRAAEANAKALAVGTKITTAAGERRRLVLPDRSIVFLRERSSLAVQADRVVLSAGEAFFETASGKLAPALLVETPKREVRARDSRFGVRVAEDGTAVLVAAGQARVAGIEAPIRAGQTLEAAAKAPQAAPRISHLVAWTRDLRSAAPLVPASEHAGGSLVARDPEGQEARLQLRRYKIDVHIEDGFARTTIDQTYFNHTQDRLEGTFRFPLPADASLSRLVMYVDGNRMEGGMVERDRARAVYERIVWEKRDPALLEWVDGTTFKMRVFPLEPRQEKRLLLSYTQRLPVLYGAVSYRFPAGHSFAEVGEWSLHVRVKGGASLGWQSESHTLAAARDGADLLLDAVLRNARLDRDVVLQVSDGQNPSPNPSPKRRGEPEVSSPPLRLGEGAGGRGSKGEDVRFSSAELDGQKYLLVRYRPALEGAAQPERRDWVVLVETSGDRDPLLARTQIELVRSLLENAGREDTFTIVTAGTRTHKLQMKPLLNDSAAIGEAIAELERSHLVGAFDLGRALNEVRELLEAGKTPYLLHVGSGIAAMGEAKTDELLKLIPNGTRYVGVGVGKRWNRAFMQAAAERTGGYFTQVNPDEPIAWRGMELAMTLNTPRLLDVRVEDKAGKTAFLPFVRMLSQGEELAAVAQVKGEMPESLRITGRVDGKEIVRDVEVKEVRENAGYLPRSWAKLEIDRLLAEDAAKHKDTIMALSKALYVMTPFTSLLVLENEDMYAQFKVDRGRKDHWAMYPAPAKIKVVVEPVEGDVGDAKKGIKPSAKVVAQTVVARTRPRVLNSGEAPRNVTAYPHSLALVRRDDSESMFARPILGLELEGKSIYSPPVNWPIEWNSITGESLSSTDTARYTQRDTMGGTASRSIELMSKPADIAEGRALEWIREFQVVKAGRQNLVLKALNNAEDEGPSSAIDAGVFFDRERWDRARKRSVLTPIKMSSANEKEKAILRRLSAPVSVNFEGTPLRAVINELREVNGINIVIDDPALQEAGISLDSPISIHLNQVFLSTLLDVILSKLHLAYVLKDEALQITTEPLARHFAPDSRLYFRPRFTNDDRLFYDLPGYAPGLNTSAADLRAVVEAEARPNPAQRPGIIDANTRALFAQARAAGWRSLTVPADGNALAYLITFDGTGRYAWERTLSSGLSERVICDGKTLWHLYPELGLAAKRRVSRFHRLDLARSLPWMLPQPEDLARGADLVRMDAHTVAVVSHGMKNARGKPLAHLQQHLVFAEGRLAERRLVEMPAKKVLRRETYSAEGTCKILDAAGKEVFVFKAMIEDSAAPKLTPDVKNLVMLDLPFRTPAQVKQSLKIEKKQHNELTFDEGHQLLAAFVANGETAQAQQVFQQALARRDQYQLGYYVLLAAAGVNLDSDNIDVLDAHPHEPLAHYLSLHSSPVLRKQASRWAAASNSWSDGILRRLTLGHALCQHWSSLKSLGSSVAQRTSERRRALAYVKQYKGTSLAWALLGLMQDRTAGEVDKENALAAYRDLASAYELFAGTQGLASYARYEQARCWWKAGQKAEAQKRFLALYDEAARAGGLLAIDSDFREALLDGGDDGWSSLMRRTAVRLLKDKKRFAVLALARQCWQLGDAAISQHLFGLAMEGVSTTGKEALPLHGAALAFLRESNQIATADRLVSKLLEDAEHARRPELWRIASQLAAQREMPARRLECLEKALELEFGDLPEVVNLENVRSEYGALLEQYESLAKSLATLKLPVPAGFRDKVVRVADRWRALDRDQERAATVAAGVLRTLGERELAWDYLTTPVALKPGESGVWVNLADTLKRQGERDLADRAFQSAFERESTNAQVLWDRADNLKQAGRLVQAQALYRQIAETDWQPRFATLKTQARWMVER